MKKQPIMNLLLSLFVFVVGFVQNGDNLICYKCDERIQDKNQCQEQSVQQEDCALSLGQGVRSVCLMTVQIFSTGQPSWVKAGCAEASLFADILINRCMTEPIGAAVAQQAESVTAGSLQADTITRCTCNKTDLCYINNTANSLHAWMGNRYASLPALLALTIILLGLLTYN